MSKATQSNTTQNREKQVDNSKKSYYDLFKNIVDEIASENTVSISRNHDTTLANIDLDQEQYKALEEEVDTESYKVADLDYLDFPEVREDKVIYGRVIYGDNPTLNLSYNHTVEKLDNTPNEDTLKIVAEVL